MDKGYKVLFYFIYIIFLCWILFLNRNFNKMFFDLDLSNYNENFIL